MYDTSQNPLPINRIELNRSRASSQAIVNLYGGILERPLLVIPEMHFHLLMQADVDPNQLQFGQTYHVQLLAYWQDSKVSSKKGTRYRDAIRLVRDDPEREAERKYRADVLQELRKNAHLLELIYRFLRYPKGEDELPLDEPSHSVQPR